MLRLKRTQVYVLSALILGISLMPAYGIFVLQRQVKLQIRMAAIEALLEEQNLRHAADAEVLGNRLDSLEAIVLGRLSEAAHAAAPTRTPSAIELWQRNRDAELRNRLLVLEAWRLRTENKK